VTRVTAAEARALLEGTTAGPWWIETDGENDTVVLIGGPGAGREVASFPFYAPHRNEANERIIKASRSLAASIVELEAERDRLRDILRCERGEWAPEGWALISSVPLTWQRGDAYVVRERSNFGHLEWRWSIIVDRYDTDESPRFVPLARGSAPTALEAIEAADAAAREPR
jgi:hypothetical protein